jgi:hypothetical protein
MKRSAADRVVYLMVKADSRRRRELYDEYMMLRHASRGGRRQSKLQIGVVAAAKAIWAKNDRVSVNKGADLLALREEFKGCGHSTIRKWISPYRPKIQK